jgi:hypothetical protein
MDLSMVVVSGCGVLMLEDPFRAGCAHDDSSLRFGPEATQFFNKDPNETP